MFIAGDSEGFSLEWDRHYWQMLHAALGARRYGLIRQLCENAS